MKIVVIGAGSIGAHVAYRLQEQGAEVTLVDAAAPGKGTTSSSIAMLSQFPQMGWVENDGRAKLREQTHSSFDDLAKEVPGDYLHKCGSLLWVSEAEEEEFAELAKIALSRGVNMEAISVEQAQQLEPGVNFPDKGTVYWEKDSAWVDGPAVVDALIKRFQELGGTLLTNTSIASFDIMDGKILAAVTQDGTRLEADQFVNAAGSWGAHLSHKAGLALAVDLVPGTIVYTAPFAEGEAPARIINTPLWCGRPDPAGGLAIHWRGHSQTKRHGENIDLGDDLIDEVAKVIPALAGTKPVRETIGIRALPHDGPIIGAVPWLPNFYHTVSHGGIGWGPTWGWTAARELIHGEKVEEVQGMNPVRFYLNPSQVGRHADDAEQTAH